MTQIVPVSQKVATIRTLLDKAKRQIAQALPRHLTPERMMRVAMTSIQRTPALLDCTHASLIGAIIQCSQLGLEPDNVMGFAYLIPYGQTCQLIIGYKGLVDLARRSGNISTIYAQPVYEHDEYKFTRHMGEDKLNFEENPGEQGELIRVYAQAKLRDGGVQFDTMRRSEIDAIRKRSRAGNAGPWVTDYVEMAKKTVLRRLCKLLPASVELHRAVTLDERAENGLPQLLEDDADEIIDVAPLVEPPTLAQAAAKQSSKGKGRALDESDAAQSVPEHIPRTGWVRNEQSRRHRLSARQTPDGCTSRAAFYLSMPK
jgi:recombination protein RecT